VALRFRLYPTVEQAQFMLERHCADVRFVWNLAVEQFNWGRPGRSAPGPAERQRQLAEARQAFEWLAGGSSSVQQQALRDFDRAVAGFFKGTHRRPTWRRKHQHEGFCVRDTKVRVFKRKWAEVAVPKLGWVRFRVSRALPESALGMARITQDKAGRWHVSFPAPQPAVNDAGRVGRSVGIDRGVATTIATSDGQMLRRPDHAQAGTQASGPVANGAVSAAQGQRSPCGYESKDRAAASAGGRPAAGLGGENHDPSGRQL
jgi:putative transposase